MSTNTGPDGHVSLLTVLNNFSNTLTSNPPPTHAKVIEVIAYLDKLYIDSSATMSRAEAAKTCLLLAVHGGKVNKDHVLRKMWADLCVEACDAALSEDPSHAAADKMKAEALKLKDVLQTESGNGYGEDTGDRGCGDNEDWYHLYEGYGTDPDES
ncbi:Kinesin-like protein KIF1B [Marssonina coronariae]|uniref:Kinesin-like protein KIF1B n=1 Tax=Diplocarpon coronariae TaxID=2795749 RepID=A0A218ZIW5_9HELO|nr:Kinesin-like protein KIF1B [Marssonina coronariae]